jgi:hypothetical protein
MLPVAKKMCAQSDDLFSRLYALRKNGALLTQTKNLDLSE